MDIGYIFQNFPELSQTFIFDQMRYLRNIGNSIQVFAKKRIIKDNDLIKDDFYDHIFIPRKAKFPGSFFAKYSRHQNEKKYEILAKLIISQYLENEKVPDVLIAHFGPNIILASWIKKLLSEKSQRTVPIIGVFHGYDLSKHIKKYGIEYYNLHKNNIDCFVVISSYWKKLLINNGFDADRVKLCRIGVSIPEKVPQKSSSRQIKNILSVGRLVDKKGFDDLIIAFSKISSKYNDLRLQIVGDGRNRNALTSLTSSLGQSMRIEFLGSLSHKDTLERIKSSDLFVLASKTALNGDMEGIPVVLMEAMASCVPVISTIHSGIPELVADGRSGFLVPENSPEKLAKVIDSAINKPTQLDEIVLEGRKVVELQYSMNTQNVRFEQLIRNTVDNRPNI